MICQKCGAENSQDAKFCAQCGARREEMPFMAPQETTGEQSISPQQIVPTPVKKQKPRWMVILLAVAVLAAAWWFFIRKDPVKDTQNYVFYQVSVSGRVRGNEMFVTIVFGVSYQGSAAIVSPVRAESMYETVTDRDELSEIIEDLYETYSDIRGYYGF